MARLRLRTEALIPIIALGISVVALSLSALGIAHWLATVIIVALIVVIPFWFCYVGLVARVPIARSQSANVNLVPKFKRAGITAAALFVLAGLAGFISGRNPEQFGVCIVGVAWSVALIYVGASRKPDNRSLTRARTHG